MSDKYPQISPYVYCNWNPVKFVDPDGKDDYDVNENGVIVRKIPNTEQDAFYMVNKEGKRIEEKSLSFSYGTIENNSRSGVFDWFNIRGDNKGEILFEFLSDNTRVEWGLFQMGIEGNNGYNSISTSHEEKTDRSSIFLYNNKYRFGYTIRNHKHNHPHNTYFPSGLEERVSGDIGFSTGLTDNALRQGRAIPHFYIYLPLTKRYIPYNKNSQKKDFSQYNGIYLNEIQVTPK